MFLDQPFPCRPYPTGRKKTDENRFPQRKIDRRKRLLWFDVEPDATDGAIPLFIGTTDETNEKRYGKPHVGKVKTRLIAL